ncbi:hypothetical protein [Mycolicibacterium parafortuitum]|nr:hypothetical protein [Mycolicibacterium parafortuitum]ORB28445.1 hypothetical protein BST38_19650 [Mycolicibacterium parafortuitum]
MVERTATLPRRTTRLAVMCLGSVCASAALFGLSAGTASADVKEVSPGPVVSSRQATDYAVVRINDFGVARGTSEARLADAGVVSATGTNSTEVRDEMKAVPGSKAKGFLGAYPVGPPIGDF